MFHTRAVLLLGLAAAVACSDRTPTTATDPAAASGMPPATSPGGSVQRPERLARLFARALKNSSFRAYVKAQLDSSPYPEHKIQLQGFLAARGRRALRDLARENNTTDDDVTREAAAAVPLEVYLPVPAHRAAWTGDDERARRYRDCRPRSARRVLTGRSALAPEPRPATCDAGDSRSCRSKPTSACRHGSFAPTRSAVAAGPVAGRRPRTVSTCSSRTSWTLLKVG